MSSETGTLAGQDQSVEACKLCRLCLRRLAKITFRCEKPKPVGLNHSSKLSPVEIATGVNDALAKLLVFSEKLISRRASISW